MSFKYFSISRTSAPSLLSSWVLLAPAIVMRISGTDLSYGAFALLVAHAARGCEQAIQALFLSWLFASLNEALFPPIGDVELIRILILIVAATRAGMDYFDKEQFIVKSGVTIPLVNFIGICFLNSIFVSELPSLSLLKTFVFGILAFSTVWIWTRSGALRASITMWFFNSLKLIALLSAFLAPLGMGYERNDFGFQGILNQPQGFGIAMALLATWQFGDMLIKQKYSVTEVAQLLIFTGLLYMTASRTGMLAFALGMGGAALIAFFSHRRELRSALFEIPPSIRLMGVGSIIIVLIIFLPEITYSVQMAIFKGEADSTISENFSGSRGELIEASYESFKEHMIFGKGFALPTFYDEFSIRYESLFGLPVSAPVEKGVLPVAVLEELGIVGGLFFVWLLYSLVRHVSRSRGFEMVALLICALAINLGEAVLFSAGGFGLLVWLFIGMALAPSASPSTQYEKK